MSEEKGSEGGEPLEAGRLLQLQQVLRAAKCRELGCILVLPGQPEKEAHEGVQRVRVDRDCDECDP